MPEKFRNKYRISSTRLKNWDYGSNAPYFVTICTKNRENYFGEIKNGIMFLSETGCIADQYWYEIPKHFPFINLDEYVVMPNHVHGISIINKMGDGGIDGAVQRGSDGVVRGDGVVQRGGGVETLHATSLRRHHESSPHNEPIPTPTEKNEKMAKISPKQGSLSTIIRSYKSAVTRDARHVNAEFGWQSRFHDHIIRNYESLERIRNYIINNPARWAEDKFFKIPR